MTPPPPVDAVGAVPDTRPLAWSRILFGVLFLMRTTPLLLPLHLDFTADTLPLLGWPTAAWQGEALLLALPAWLVATLCVLRTLAAVSFTVGVRPRMTGLVAGASGYLVMLQQPFGIDATLQLLFEGTILLALTDVGAKLALRPEPPRQAASSFMLIRVFLASIYLWAAFVKLRPDWLDGRTLGLFYSEGVLSGRLTDLLLSTHEGQKIVARVVVTSELSLPVLLLWSRTRRLAPLLALLLHSAIEIAARPDLIGWEMAALLLCLWPEPLERSRIAAVATV